MNAINKAMQNGLPRAASTRPRDTLQMLLLGPVESVTMALRRGDEFSPQSIRDLEAFCRRAEALRDALDARLSVLEDS